MIFKSKMKSVISFVLIFVTLLSVLPPNLAYSQSTGTTQQAQIELRDYTTVSEQFVKAYEEMEGYIKLIESLAGDEQSAKDAWLTNDFDDYLRYTMGLDNSGGESTYDKLVVYSEKMNTEHSDRYVYKKDGEEAVVLWEKEGLPDFNTLRLKLIKLDAMAIELKILEKKASDDAAANGGTFTANEAIPKYTWSGKIEGLFKLTTLNIGDTFQTLLDEQNQPHTNPVDYCRPIKKKDITDEVDDYDKKKLFTLLVSWFDVPTVEMMFKMRYGVDMEITDQNNLPQDLDKYMKEWRNDYGQFLLNLMEVLKDCGKYIEGFEDYSVINSNIERLNDYIANVNQNYKGSNIQPLTSDNKSNINNVSSLTGIGMVQDLFTVDEEDYFTTAEVYDELLAFTSSFIPFDTNLYDASGQLEVLSEQAQSVWQAYSKYRQPLAMTVDTHNVYESIISASPRKLQYATLNEYIKRIQQSQDVFFYINTISNAELKRINATDIAVTNEVKVEATEESNSTTTTTTTTTDSSQETTSIINEQQVDNSWITSNPRFFGYVYGASANVNVNSKAYSEMISGDTVGIRTITGKTINSLVNGQEVNVNDLHTIKTLKEGSDTEQVVTHLDNQSLSALIAVNHNPQALAYNYVLMHNTLEDQTYLRDHIERDMQNLLYMDFLGNIVTESGYVVVPAIANASRFRDLDKYSMVNAMFINSYPDVSISSEGNYMLPDLEKNKYVLYYSTSSWFATQETIDKTINADEAKANPLSAVRDASGSTNSLGWGFAKVNSKGDGFINEMEVKVPRLDIPLYDRNVYTPDATTNTETTTEGEATENKPEENKPEDSEKSELDKKIADLLKDENKDGIPDSLNIHIADTKTFKSLGNHTYEFLAKTGTIDTSKMRVTLNKEKGYWSFSFARSLLDRTRMVFNSDDILEEERRQLEYIENEANSYLESITETTSTKSKARIAPRNNSNNNQTTESSENSYSGVFFELSKYTDIPGDLKILDMLTASNLLYSNEDKYLFGMIKDNYYVYSWRNSSPAVSVAVGKNTGTGYLTKIPNNLVTYETAALTKLNKNKIDFYKDTSPLPYMDMDIALSIVASLSNGSASTEMSDHTFIDYKSTLKEDSLNYLLGTFLEGLYNPFVGDVEANIFSYLPTPNNLTLLNNIAPTLIRYLVIIIVLVVIAIFIMTITVAQRDGTLVASDVIKSLVVSILLCAFILKGLPTTVDLIFQKPSNYLMSNQILLTTLNEYENQFKLPNNTFFSNNPKTFQSNSSIVLAKLTKDQAIQYREMEDRPEYKQLFYYPQYDNSKQYVFGKVYIQGLYLKIDVIDLLNTTSIEPVLNPDLSMMYMQTTTDGSDIMAYYIPYYHFIESLTDKINTYSSLANNYYTSLKYDSGYSLTSGRVSAYINSIFFIEPSSISEYLQKTIKDKGNIDLEFSTGDKISSEIPYFTLEDGTEVKITADMANALKFIQDGLGDTEDWLGLRNVLFITPEGEVSPFEPQYQQNAEESIWYPAFKLLKNDEQLDKLIKEVNDNTRKFVIQYLTPIAPTVSDEALMKIISLKATIEYNKVFNQISKGREEATLDVRNFNFINLYPIEINGNLINNDFLFKLSYIPLSNIFISNGESLGYYLASNLDMIGLLFALIHCILTLSRFVIRFVCFIILSISALMYCLAYIMRANGLQAKLRRIIFITTIITLPVALSEIIVFLLCNYTASFVNINIQMLILMSTSIVLTILNVFLIKQSGLIGGIKKIFEGIHDFRTNRFSSSVYDENINEMPEGYIPPTDYRDLVNEAEIDNLNYNNTSNVYLISDNSKDDDTIVNPPRTHKKPDDELIFNKDNLYLPIIDEDSDIIDISPEDYSEVSSKIAKPKKIPKIDDLIRGED